MPHGRSEYSRSLTVLMRASPRAGAAISAARSALRNSMARVMGPTPPRRGVIQPATSATSGWASGISFLPSKVVPADTTAAPGLTMSGVSRCGPPGRRHDDVAPCARCAAMSSGSTPVCTTVTAALQPGPLQREQVGQRPADRHAAADDHDVAALDRDVVGVQQLDDARRRARQRARRAEHEAAEVHRVQPVDVLGRVDGQQGRSSSRPVGQRQLHQERARPSGSALKRAMTSITSCLASPWRAGARRPSACRRRRSPRASCAT